MIFDEVNTVNSDRIAALESQLDALKAYCQVLEESDSEYVKMASIMESSSNNDGDFFDESALSEYTFVKETFEEDQLEKSALAQYRKDCANIRKLIKQGKKKEAQQAVENCKKTLKEYKSKIQNVKVDVGTAIINGIYADIKHIIIWLLPVFAIRVHDVTGNKAATIATAAAEIFGAQIVSPIKSMIGFASSLFNLIDIIKRESSKKDSDKSKSYLKIFDHAKADAVQLLDTAIASLAIVEAQIKKM